MMDTFLTKKQNHKLTKATAAKYHSLPEHQPCIDYGLFNKKLMPNQPLALVQYALPATLLFSNDNLVIGW